jgi:hypothetical protein
MNSYLDRWAVLTTTPHSPRGWGGIAEAVRIADAVPRDAFGDTIIRGGEDWCRLAITALESPQIAARSKHHPATLPDRCLADADLLRAWLNAPHAYADPVVATNADALSLVDWAEASEDSAHRAVDNVLTAAQDVGVYGVSDFRIELHRLIDADSMDIGHLVVLRPDFGPGLASAPLPLGELVPGQRAKVAGAVSVLTAIATIVNDTLDLRDTAATTRDRSSALLPAQTDGHTATRTQPFPSLSATTDPARAAAAGPDAGPGPQDQHASGSVPPTPGQRRRSR